MSGSEVVGVLIAAPIVGAVKAFSLAFRPYLGVHQVAPPPGVAAGAGPAP